jgi:hypothetical protein
VWEDEDSDDGSTCSDSDDLDRPVTVVVTTTNEQEENVIARPGFTVHFLLVALFSPLTSILLSEDGQLTHRQSSTTAENAHRPRGLGSEATPWGNHARFHDCQVQACRDVGRDDLPGSSECFADPPSFVSFVLGFMYHLDRIVFLVERMLYYVSRRKWKISHWRP